MSTTERKGPTLDTSSVGNTTYAALHPEVEGLNPEEYPNINKLGILADVAPYSREYNRIRAVVDKQSAGDLELRARYEQIVEQVRQTKESTLQVDQRRFDAPIDKIEGTVKSDEPVFSVICSSYPVQLHRLFVACHIVPALFTPRRIETRREGRHSV